MQHGDAAMEAIIHGTKSFYTMQVQYLVLVSFFQLCAYMFVGIDSHTSQASGSIVHVDI